MVTLSPASVVVIPSDQTNQSVPYSNLLSLRPDKEATILAPVEAQCDWLRQIGFERVDCYQKLFELAVFGGVKPISSEI